MSEMNESIREAMRRKAEQLRRLSAQPDPSLSNLAALGIRELPERDPEEEGDDKE